MLLLFAAERNDRTTASGQLAATFRVTRDRQLPANINQASRGLFSFPSISLCQPGATPGGGLQLAMLVLLPLAPGRNKERLSTGRECSPSAGARPFFLLFFGSEPARDALRPGARGGSGPPAPPTGRPGDAQASRKRTQLLALSGSACALRGWRPRWGFYQGLHRPNGRQRAGSAFQTERYTCSFVSGPPVPRAHRQGCNCPMYCLAVDPAILACRATRSLVFVAPTPPLGRDAADAELNRFGRRKRRRIRAVTALCTAWWQPDESR